MTFYHCPPEQLFDVDLVVDPDGSTRASMPLGPWTSYAGGPSVAAVGVLLDDLLGYAFNAARRSGWSVSTQVGFDLVAPLPASGWLHGRGSVAGSDSAGAVARGELVDDAGAVVAHGFAHGRFVPDAPPEGTGSTPGLTTSPSDDVVARLGAVTVVEGGLEVAVTRRLTNPRGTLHGGVSFALAELAAALAVPDLVTSTSVRVHLLRPGTDGDRLVVEPVVAHRGRTLAVVDVVGRRADGKAVFRATVTRA